ncbi:putative regulatory protein, FmdB family protein [Mycobacterium bohemicum DSM 44277]|uniref:FmdB family transcriptional regulator n=2 Tax=Mycobacterium bohemicum TaxID=56425 RepID=A0A1X1R2R8_MYCBE|nr:FmdB family zinc ribbon protein [Mycobacterium bohemicum]MCV6969931.1 FmdB family transcriptional regulator [Mycobacterium bohemicum]ORU98571.1 FmdB family transcriptional regulator [Mycobacterium bohemicum]CPR08548.1 putative regulatory protein, FmdB family protein [Mycobacterium bohemicum DSM 44277]
MPTYTYECTECGDRFDIVQAFSDDALTTCERCAGRLRKRFNSVGIVFKGSGFYRTDSRESAKSSTNGSAKSDNGSGSGSAEKSTEKSTPSEKSGSGEKSASSSTPSTAAATT